MASYMVSFKWDQERALQIAKEEAYEEGYKEGFKEGFEEGIRSVIKQVVPKLLENKVPLYIIAEATHLTEKEIREMAKGVNN